MNDWIKDLPPAHDTVISTALKGDTMETTGTRINQQPELYLAADVEQMAKGGWKRTVKCSVRVFNGDETDAYKYMERLLENGLGIANDAVNNFDKHQEVGNQ